MTPKRERDLRAVWRNAECSRGVVLTLGPDSNPHTFVALSSPAMGDLLLTKGDAMALALALLHAVDDAR